MRADKVSLTVQWSPTVGFSWRRDLEDEERVSANNANFEEGTVDRLLKMRAELEEKVRKSGKKGEQ